MNKKTIILAIALAALLVMAYIYQGPLKKWQENLGQPVNFLAKVQTDKIDKMEITRNNINTVLEKSDAKWKIAGTKDFYIESSLAPNLNSALADAVKANLELASNNKDRKAEFNVDDSGVKVKLYESNKLVADFIVGKLSSDYSSTYISNSTMNATYEVKVDLNSAFYRDDWRDYTIFSISQDKINKIRFQYPDREFTVEKKNDIWTGVLPYNFTVGADKINSLLSAMANLKAEKIPEQTFKNTGLEKHLIILQLTGEGIDSTLMIGASVTLDKVVYYYAKRADSDNIYLITKSQRDEFDKWIWQLK